MPGPRTYHSAATRAGLALLSRGRCYNPDRERPHPIIVRRGGEPYGAVFSASPGAGQAPGGDAELPSARVPRRRWGVDCRRLGMST